jgi:hypothetical protein
VAARDTTPADADLSVFESEVRKTGFVLENRITQMLRTAGWSVISNKYYVDDASETVREIDLVAYRVNKVKHFRVFTTLLISCKKNESNLWALLARKANHHAPNADWWPLHVWTNDSPLSFVLSEKEVARRYHDNLKAKGVSGALSLPQHEVFAFQEMNRQSGAPRNDSNIFSAVTSLMKAQAYELGALPQRLKDPAVYQFNLLSIVDADLIRLDFEDDGITAHPIDAEHYVARYIIGKRETFARIRFVTAKAIAELLPDYARLHKANLTWFAEQYDGFFGDAVESAAKLEVLLPAFHREISWRLGHRASHAGIDAFDSKHVEVYWKKQAGRVVITVPGNSSVAEFLNRDAEARRIVGAAMKKVFRYEGEFEFEEEFPF